MSSIDKAFVKAFHKNRQATDSTESPEEARAAALGMSTIWIDASSEQRWRSDQAHSQPQSSVNTRSRGANPRRFARAVQATKSNSPSAAINDVPEHATPIQPLATEKVFSPTRPETTRSGERTEMAFDMHMFDAINVTPPPFAIFPQTQAVDEAPAAEVPAARVATVPGDAGASQFPNSVPFVKIHQRHVADTAEPVAGPASPHAEVLPANAPVVFEAAWEVDAFEYPLVVRKLLDDEGLVADAVAPLVDACRGGLQTLAITSSATQQGRTTLAVGLAVATARAGLRVALLDIDTERPALADRLQLDVEMGWTEAVHKGIPLQETAIYSVADQLTLLPIIPSSTRIAPTREEIVETLKTLRDAFDLIILDAAAIDMEAAMKTQLPANQLDSALVVRDRRESNESGFEECVAALRQMGIEHIGVADNFTGSTL